MRLLLCIGWLLAVVVMADGQAKEVELVEGEERAGEIGVSRLSTVAPPTDISSRPMDCADYLMQGHNTSGVYEIFPFTCTCRQQRVHVWCDMQTDGGGWTVFLSRQKQNKQLEFNRTWQEYKDGFGDPTGEYWLGNELLHTMTYGRSYSLRQDVNLTSGGNSYFTVRDFKVANEETKYKLVATAGYSGDSYYFSSQNNKYFTTFDRDHDGYSSGNCANTIGGGWWHYGSRCQYYHPTVNNYTNSIKISSYHSNTVVTKLELKFRPATCDSSVKTIHLNDRCASGSCH